MGKKSHTQSETKIVLDDDSSEPGYKNTADTSNQLVLPGKRKKNLSHEDDKNERSEDRKRREARKRRKNVIEAKLSKSKRKKLEKIRERKQKKESKELLLENLQQYQLSGAIMQKLSSTAQVQAKAKKLTSEVTSAQHKLNSIAGSGIGPASFHKIPERENYYETGSESESEDEKPATNDLAATSVETPISEQAEGSQIRSDIGFEELCNDKQIKNEHQEISESHNVEANKVKSPEKRQKPAGDLVKNLVSRKNVLLSRSSEIQAQRSKLPIFGEEQVIVEAINENMVIIVSGETGSGKTTQIPQFLYEAGYASEGQIIGITEPRRVAAISMARRVAYEMNLPKAVSYQIRYEGDRSPDTQILFMTDGVLMKELQKDVMLSSYSVIIIDEAHERSMYSDVLIGMLSRIAPVRGKSSHPLKLILMSATLQLSDFTQKILFPSPPRIIKVDSRQYPVSIHFERRTPENYVQAVFRKICKVHERLPPGTILVFVSGQLEVKYLVKKLADRYPMRKRSTKSISNKKTKSRKSSKKLKEVKLENITYEELNDDEVNVDDRGLSENPTDDLFDNEEMSDPAPLSSPAFGCPPLYCLPMFSLLSSEKQRRVFEPVPDGCRMCVIATNVAETSITIPNVRYVIDSGKEKYRLYDVVTGVSKFEIRWVSQASANQRAGRAGRVQAGHVYRMYSSAVFSDFVPFNEPEILNKPVDQLVLQLKSMNIVKVVNFPFPTRPSIDLLIEAESRLLKLGALHISVKNELKEARITPLGMTLSLFPLAPKYAKMLVMANQNNLLAYACCLVAILSVREPLIHISCLRGETCEETRALMLATLKQRRSWCSQGQSRRFADLSVLMTAVATADSVDLSDESCSRVGVRYKALTEIKKLRRQLTNLINSSCKLETALTIDPNMTPPTDLQLKLLRQIIVSCLPENIARRVDRSTVDDEIPKGAYQCQRIEGFVFIDASSMLYKDEPDWIVYQEIVKMKDKMCMQNVAVVEPEWLPFLASGYCEFAAVKDAEPRYDSKQDAVVLMHSCSFGNRHWKLDNTERPLPVNIDTYRQFARFILDGSVISALGEYTKKLLASPLTMTRSWAKLQSRTESLLNDLIEYEVLSRKELLEVWKKQSEYLLESYLMWLPQFLHDEVRLKWPPV